MNKKLSLAALVFFLALFSSVVASEGIDPGNPLFVKSIRAELWIHGTGTITGPLSQSDSLTLKILVPKSSENQAVESISETLKYKGQSIVPTSHETDEFGNNYAVFPFETLSERNFEYDIKAIISTKTYPELKDYNVSSGFSEEMKKFIQPTQHAESNDATIRTIAAGITASDSELESIARTAEWVNNYVQYDSSYWGKQLSARQVIDSKRGVCEEFSNLTSALLKAKGIPVRTVSGLVFSSKDWNNHAWVEAYVPGRGWIGIDSTYGEAGFLDGTHIEMGKTDDRSNASDQSYSYIGDFELELESQRKVNVLSVEKFENVAEISPKNFTDTNMFEESFGTSAKKGKKFDLNAFVQNRTGFKTILPAQLGLHNAFVCDGQACRPKRLVVLNPFEKKELNWQAIAPDANANYIYGYRLETMGNGFEGVIPVMDRGSVNGHNGNEIIVKESIPTISENETLELKLLLFNAGKNIADINITVYGSDSSQLVSANERLLPLESRQFIYLIPRISEQEFVLLKAFSNNFRYEEKINIRKEIETPPAKQNNANTAVQSEANASKGTSDSANNAKSEIDSLLNTGLLVPIGIFAALVLALFVIIGYLRSPRH